MDEDNRRRTVANALRPLLEEGDAFHVYCYEGEVLVGDAERSVCAARHPRLYGCLLRINVEIGRAAGGIVRLPALLALTFCVGLHLHWWDGLLGIAVADRLNSAWFYLVVFFAVFQACDFLARRLETSAYRRDRAELLALLADAGLDRDTLLALIESDAGVVRAGRQLALDRDAGSPTPPE